MTLPRVLIGIDGTPQSEVLVRRAWPLLPKPARLTIAMVVRPVPVAGVAAPAMQPAAAAWPIASTDAQEASLDAARSTAEALAARFGDDVESHVALGEPGPALCALAETDHYNMIVVGSERLGPLRRVVLGSVSDHVVHHATCPVLVMHDDDSTNT